MSSPIRMRERSLTALFLAALAAVLPLACSSSAAPAAQSPFDEDRAWKHLETLVGFGVRSAESEGLEKTRAYLMRELESTGSRP